MPVVAKRKVMILYHPESSEVASCGDDSSPARWTNYHLSLRLSHRTSIADDHSKYDRERKNEKEKEEKEKVIEREKV